MNELYTQALVNQLQSFFIDIKNNSQMCLFYYIGLGKMSNLFHSSTAVQVIHDRYKKILGNEKMFKIECGLMQIEIDIDLVHNEISETVRKRFDE